jgi:hypothetical protein
MQDLNPTPETSWREFAYGLAIVVLIGIVGWSLLEQSPLATLALSSRFPIDYVEGLSLDRSLLMPSLQRLYPASFDVAPYRTTMHPPLFYALQNALLQISGPTLWTGRMISQVSAALAVLFMGLTMLKLTRDISGTLVAALLLASYPQLTTWALLNSPETLAFAFALGGLCAVIYAPLDRKAAAAMFGVATLLFVGSIATDPLFALPPMVAAGIHLRKSGRQRAAIAIAGAVILASIALFVALNTATQGGFALNLITGGERMLTRNRTLSFMLNMMLRSGLSIIAIVLFFVIEPLTERHRAAPTALGYLVTAALIALLSGRDGSNMSVMLSLAAALSFSVGAMLSWLGRNRWVKAGLIVIVLLQVNTLQEWRETDFVPNIIRRVESRREMPKLLERFAAADYQILTDEYIGLQVLAGKAPALYPYEYNQLYMRGYWSEQALIEAIQRKDFKLIVWYEPPDALGEPFIVRRWPESVRRTVYANYDSEGFTADAVVYVAK